eukprot:scaffold1934_cov76-Cyclotella_meneghiniana.AAC.5
MSLFFVSSLFPVKGEVLNTHTYQITGGPEPRGSPLKSLQNCASQMLVRRIFLNASGTLVKTLVTLANAVNASQR